MGSVGTGAIVEELENICPICGASPRKDKCMRPINLTNCPNKGLSCYNKDGEERRIGCEGYLQGNIGFSTLLGNNIIIQMRSGVFKKLASVPLTRYEDKFINSYKKIFDEDANKNIPDDVRKEILKYKLEELKQNQPRIHPQDRDIHPLHIVFDSGYGSTIHAHHIICSNAMDSEEWRKVCKGIGYNINCRLNGVFLPSVVAIACTAKVPLHTSNHDKGFAGENSYAAEVEDIADQILEKVRENIELCKDTKEVEETAKGIIEDLNYQSKNIFEKIRDFVWTITADGFDYMPGNPIGCSNHGKMSTKKKEGEILNIRKKHEEIARDYLEDAEEGVMIDIIEKERNRKVGKYHSILHADKKDGLGDLDIYCKGGKKDEENPNPTPREHKFAVDHFTEQGRYSGNKYTLIYGE